MRMTIHRFTERSKKLPSHAGEVAFPGGKKEKKIKTNRNCFRETHEEIGMSLIQLEYLADGSSRI